MIITFYATFSKRFIIRNMNPAEIRHNTMKTDHTRVKGRSFHKYPPTLTRKLPMAVATNHPPIIAPLYFGGATLLTKLIPIGLSNNSPNVSTRYVPINQLPDANGTNSPASLAADCSLGVSRPRDANTIRK